MTLFQDYPVHKQFRPLSDKTEVKGEDLLNGEDVFALQTALAGAGYPCGPFDGWFGPATGKAVWGFQTNQQIIRDGIAGPGTNRRLIEVLVTPQSKRYSLSELLLLGHLAHESSLYPGRYSPRREDGTYDAGIGQRNTAHTPAVDGFNTPQSIAALAASERKFYDEFRGINGRRRWMLAAGGWNAPAYVRWIAKHEGCTWIESRDTKQPSATAQALLEVYMIDATKMMP